MHTLPLPSAETRQFDLIIFDWDGTLMDSTAMIARALQSAFAEHGLAMPSDQQARHVIGLGMAEALTWLLPEGDQTLHQQLAQSYRQNWRQGADTLVFYPHAITLLEALRVAGYTLAVATGKSRAGLDRALDEMQVRHHFAVTRCADESFSKPHPAMVNEILDRLQIPAGRTLVIGDTTHDLEMAHQAHVAAIGILHGAHDKATLLTAKPHALVADLPAFADWLRHHG